MRLIGMVYALASYAAAVCALLYAALFTSNFLVPKTVDSGPAGPWLDALLIDLVLLAAFAIQHSVMARPRFKAWWTTIVPEPIERSTFILFTSLVLWMIYSQWRPIEGIVWSVETQILRNIIWGLCVLGWLIVLLSTFMINHFDMFGLRQAYLAMAQLPYTPLQFTERWMYAFVRHPIMLGLLIALWAVPTMTLGHLLFTVGCTGYVFVGLWFEERDLLSAHGAAFRRYQERVPMLIPRIGR